jgi:hypothetical protein
VSRHDCIECNRRRRAREGPRLNRHSYRLRLKLAGKPRGRDGSGRENGKHSRKPRRSRKNHKSLHCSTTISLQSADLGTVNTSPLNLYLIDHKRKRVVGLEGFEPPTHRLGNLVPLLSSFENFILYYIRQPVTNLMILGRVLVLTRFERITATDLLQASSIE